ncbi:MAG: hypothetical protein IPM60_15510 [Rhodospirillales bacterium]|nr:hypothetical protein [Rhodospirillales bacterium]
MSGRKEPYGLSLPYNIDVVVRPLTSSGMAVAQAAARRRIEALEEQVRERKESGLDLGELPDLGDEAEHDALYHGILVHELAARHIVSWSGVLDADGESNAAVTREAVAAVLDLYPIGERFFQEFTLRQVLLNAAKNASGPSAAGTSRRAEGQDTAKAATTTGNSAPTEASA